MPKLVLGTGMGPLQFGMDTKQVQEVFGKPESTYDDTDTPSWYYFDPHHIVLYFDEDKKLSSIAVEYAPCVINDFDFCGLSESDLRNSIKELEMGVLEDGLVQRRGRMKNFSVPEIGLYFQLRNDFVYRVRIEVLPQQ